MTLSTDTKRERKLFLWQILFTGLKAVETNPVYANNLTSPKSASYMYVYCLHVLTYNLFVSK